MVLVVIGYGGCEDEWCLVMVVLIVVAMLVMVMFICIYWWLVAVVIRTTRGISYGVTKMVNHNIQLSFKVLDMVLKSNECVLPYTKGNIIIRVTIMVLHSTGYVVAQ
jgi:hypothetical protein